MVSSVNQTVCLMYLLCYDFDNKKVAAPAVSSVAKRTISVREVWGSIPGPVKSTQCRQRLATVATFFGAVLPRR